jgi:hypothetical protein
MEIGAGDLDPSLDGSYGFMYSGNMRQHIPDLDGAFQGMASAHPVLPAGDSLLFVRSIASGRLGEQLAYKHLLTVHFDPRLQESAAPIR